MDVIEVRRDDPTAPHVAALLAEHLAQQRGAVPPGFAFALGAEALATPDVTFWTAWLGGTLAGCGALRMLDAEHGEVKSMRTTGTCRGRGVARALLARIVDEARRRRLQRLSLETGASEAYLAATRLYIGAGFVDAPAFGDYQTSPHNRFMTLSL